MSKYRVTDANAHLASIGIISRGASKTLKPVTHLASKILEFLKSNRGWKSFGEVQHRTEVDIIGDQRVLPELKKNDKIIIQDNRLIYKPSFPNINNVEDIKSLLLANPLGILRSELDDCFIGADMSVKSIVESNWAYEQQSEEAKQTVVYPNPMHPSTSGVPKIQVDADLKELWESVVMPKTVHALDEQLKDMGLLPADELDHLNDSTGIRKRSGAAETSARAVKRKRTQRGQNVNLHMLGPGMTELSELL